MGLGLNVLESVEEAKKAQSAVVVLPFPINEEKAKGEAKRLLDEFNPSLVAAVEKVSPNVKGIHHSASGFSVHDHSAKVGILWEDATAQGIPTIGIADGGNEIGMGNIMETVKKIVPNAAKCKCPCGAGTAAALKATELFAAYISNWGAYAIAAGLAALKDDLNLVQTGAMELRMVRACVDAGAIDGVTQLTYPGADGEDEEVNSWIPEMLRRAYTKYFK